MKDQPDFTSRKVPNVVVSEFLCEILVIVSLHSHGVRVEHMYAHLYALGVTDFEIQCKRISVYAHIQLYSMNPPESRGAIHGSRVEIY